MPFITTEKFIITALLIGYFYNYIKTKLIESNNYIILQGGPLKQCFLINSIRKNVLKGLRAKLNIFWIPWVSS